LFNALTVENITLVVLTLVPGLIILFARSYFITARIMKLRDLVLGYLVVTMVYWGALILFCGDELFGLTTVEPLRLKIAMALALIVVLPALVGTGLGWEIQAGGLRKLLRCIGLNPVHVVPSAWDWKFSNMDGAWILVTLKNGTKFRGYFGDQSFSSSDPDERDLYISHVFKERKKKGASKKSWKEVKGKSVWVRGEEIVSIEFIQS